MRELVEHTPTVGRRGFLQALGGLGIGTAAFHRALALQAEQGRVSAAMIAEAEWIAGIELDEEQREQVADAVDGILRSGERLREIPVDADTVPALTFRPDFFYEQAEAKRQGQVSAQVPAQVQVSWSVEGSLAAVRPRSVTSETDMAFASIQQQASWLATGQVSSRQLTELYLKRLKKYDPLLKCVVTLLEELALEQADASDERRGKGISLGVLDGIPWVAKDLVAVPPWKTTWGAEPFQDQVREATATVAERLSAAGAVLLAKVSLGAMAWGDRWFGGLTRNPWNPQQGSSGSSAGSASAVAAGLATFALGSETLGSIVSPTTRCRTCGLRPTFGRVSRAGCMPLAWSMDKIGPIARHVDDLAFVFASLLGSDGRDPTVVERSFRWPAEQSLAGLRVGITGDQLDTTEEAALEYLKSEGAELVDIDLDSELPTSAMNFILGVEASTVFDDAFRQDPQADYGRWPDTFRQSQFVPAIQYLRANRLRSQLITETEKKLGQCDVLLAANDLLLTNLTGHPSVVVACNESESRGISLPGVIKLTSAAYREDALLAVAQRLQLAFPPTPSEPPLDEWLAKQAQAEESQ